MRPAAVLVLGLFAMLGAPLPGDAAELTAKGVEFFESKIRPVLTQRCYGCHSEAAKEVKGGLLLDTRQGLLKGGESGAAVVPGEIEDSLLIQALRYETYEMPPGGKLPDNVIADFEEWIRMGAPDPRTGKASVKRVSINEARQFWSFKRPVVVDPPVPQNAAWPRTPIDQFVLSKLVASGLEPVADADRETLLRRVTFDLTGLPPTPEQLAAFTAPESSQTLSDVIDRLLDTPQYGERWGRHWLDVVRFGESAGKERNVVYPYAWRYRNYVIDAFNADKPYDRFVREQIAGDLLAAKSASERNENLMATGFLAIGTRGLNERNREQYRMDVVDEQLDVTTRAFLGMTVACARCHDHKFDPISANDYYALAGIFRSTDTFAGVEPGNNKTGYSGEFAHLVTGTGSGTGSGTETLSEEQLKEIKRLEEQLADARQRLNRIKQVVAGGLPKAKSPKKAAGKAVTKEQLVQQRARLEERVRTLESELKRSRSTPDGDGEPVMAVRDAARIENCRVNIRGEVKELGPEVPRGVPVVLAFDRNAKFDTPQSGRMQLASWIVSKDNPLTARVMVNRIWAHLFGAGIVDPPDNFGALGTAPTHPELLDYLAVKFMQQGWSVKQLIREIMLSRTYQLSSRHQEANYQKDPDNRLLWRMNRRRLEAECIRDAILAIAGKLDPYRPPSSPAEKLAGEEIGRGKRRDGAGDVGSSLARSVYLPIFRNALPDALAVFDMADPSLMVAQREVTTVAPQALFMMNSPFVIENANHVARRVLAAHTGDDVRVDFAFRLILNRPPTPSERSTSLEFLRGYRELLAAAEGRPQARPAELGGPAINPNELAGWASLCQTLIASGEFRYLY